jgi:hypothetical protein
MSGSHLIDAPLRKELADFCRSEALSVDGLREIFEEHRCTPNNHIDYTYEFFLEACRNERVTEGILGCLLEYFPVAFCAAASGGMTMIHYICYNKNVTRGMVQLLVDVYPKCSHAIIEPNNTGVTPLHMLCANKKLNDSTAVDILGFFLERCPEAARRAGSNNGALPIHVACAVGLKSVEFCRMLVEAYPGSVKITTSEDILLPVHVACRHCSVAVAEYLLKLYPEGINVANRGGAYPIHAAIIRLENEAPTIALEMVQMLLDCDPTVASQKFGSLFPLSLVCSKSMSFRGDDGVATSKANAALKIVQALYDAYPEAIEGDSLSLFINSFPEEIQAFINTQITYARLARNSTARQMKKRDENGQVPLHRALRDSATLGSIKLIVKRNPSAVLVPDNSGALPLHVACQHNDSTKVVDYLIGLDPNTLTAVDRAGNTALHVACRGAKYDTIALLLEKYDAVSVSQSNVYNKLPIHLLFESNAVANRADDTKYLENVFQLLRAYPETVMVSEDGKQATIPQGGRPSPSRNGKKRKYRA